MSATLPQLPPAVAYQVATAVATLRSGGVIAMPTDTLYALVAPATAPEAVRRVFEIKGREPDKALPLFVAGVEMAEQVSVLNAMARRLIRRYWPGALTIVLPVRRPFDSLALAGSDTIAMRVPDNDIARAVIYGLEEPVTATSANLSGGVDPASAAEVERQIGAAIDYLLDGGDCPVGVPSTIVDCTGAEPVILRQGAVSREQIDAALAEEA